MAAKNVGWKGVMSMRGQNPCGKFDAHCIQATEFEWGDTRWFLIVMALVAGTALAADWTVPQRGTPERKAVMDALRPHAEWLFGAPVEIFVHDLRRAGNTGY